ncbi:HNH endonuclease signature motif containing protein [Streptomyces sp. CH6]|uniref:HNH endonuclease signature motif containing protein n=1 Tax=unclassified Streptomyces TaxID=2593676 RepID=UPI003D06F385
MAKTAPGPFSLTHDAPGRCRLWTATRNEKGYGKFWHNGRMIRAHRWAYEHYVGPIPAGLELDHRCGHRDCVNPAHLDPVTHAENVARSGGPSARNARKQTCPAGHRYDRVRRDGSRRCRTCDNANARARARARRSRTPQLTCVTTLPTRLTPERTAA